MGSDELLVKQEKKHADRMQDSRSTNLAYVCNTRESRQTRTPRSRWRYQFYMFCTYKPAYSTQFMSCKKKVFCVLVVTKRTSYQM